MKYQSGCRHLAVLFLLTGLAACGGGDSTPPQNQVPIAAAGTDQSVAAGSTVTLSGMTSNDPDGDTLSYAWTQVTGEAVALSGASTAVVTFAAPSASTATTLVFRLTVSDGRGGSASDDISVQVAASAPSNQPPVADAGADQVVTSGATVTLDGSGSSDPDGDTLSYAWTQVSGGAVTLSGANAATATFTASTVSAPETQIFRLMVGDGRGGTSSSDISITVLPDVTGEQAMCGNNIVETGEDCDDANTNDADMCNRDCTFTAQFAAYDQTIKSLLDQYEVPGAVVAVAKDGQLKHVRAFGMADRTAGVAMSPATRFRIASLSKPITSVAIHRLFEQGQLGPSDKVLTLLGLGTPADSRWNDITIEHLLIHAGGFDRDLSGDPMFQNQNIAAQSGTAPPAGLDSIVAHMLQRNLDFAPGSRFAYSNFGYALLGLVIEKAAGMPYAQYVHQAVLNPAGISRMELGRTLPPLRPSDESAYHPYPGEPPGQSVFSSADLVAFPDGGFYLEAMAAHGGWIASAVDLLRFLHAADGRASVPDVIGAPAVAGMIARPALTEYNGTASYYARGWLIRPVGSDANWWHDGSLPGTSTIFVRTWDGFTWVALVNTRPQLADAFAGALDDAMWEARNTVQSWPDHDLFDRYE